MLCYQLYYILLIIEKKTFDNINTSLAIIKSCVLCLKSIFLLRFVAVIKIIYLNNFRKNIKE